jgi:hypothetical protein
LNIEVCFTFSQALLPIREGSLIYGSEDAGKTVLKENETLNAAVEQAAKRLRLRRHVVGPERVELDSAVDVEGHLGMDGRFYLLDMARAFPPEAPSEATHLRDVIADGSQVSVQLFNKATGTVSQCIDSQMRNVQKLYSSCATCAVSTSQTKKQLYCS